MMYYVSTMVGRGAWAGSHLGGVERCIPAHTDVVA